MTEKRTKIGFIGGGNMAQAIIAGLLRVGHQPDCVHVSDPSADQLERVRGQHPDIITGTDNAATLAAANVLVLAIKPQVMADVLAPLAASPRPELQLVVSIAAGVRLATLSELLAPTRAIVRVMPNQPALIGAGMAVLVATPGTSANQRAQAEYIAGATGRAEWIEDEDLMDAVTAVSGSGPAYFYLLMETIEACARNMGIPADLARIMTRQTAFGAARVALESELELAGLRESVTSKGGTTAAALASFEESGFSDTVRRALRAAHDRSAQLGGRN